MIFFNLDQLRLYHQIIVSFREVIDAGYYGFIKEDLIKQHNFLIERVEQVISSRLENGELPSLAGRDSPPDYKGPTASDIYIAFRSMPSVDMPTMELRRCHWKDRRWYRYFKEREKTIDLAISNLSQGFFERMPVPFHLCVLSAILARMAIVNELATGQVSATIACPTWFRMLRSYVRGIGEDETLRKYLGIFEYLDSHQLELYLECLSGFRDALRIAGGDRSSDDIEKVERIYAAVVSVKLEKPGDS